MVVVLGARVVRPLEPFAEGFAGELTRQGYTVQTSRQQLGLVAHLSRWMSEQRIGGGVDATGRRTIRTRAP